MRSASLSLAAQARPSFVSFRLSSEEKRGRRAEWRDSVLMCTPPCEGVAPPGAPSGVFLQRQAALFGGRLNDRRQPSSWRAARSGQPGGAPTPPECVLAKHARRRRSAPHEPAQPVRVPHGSGQLWGYDPIGILSRGRLWTMMARESKSNALSAQKETKPISARAAHLAAGHFTCRRHPRHDDDGSGCGASLVRALRSLRLMRLRLRFVFFAHAGPRRRLPSAALHAGPLAADGDERS